MFMSSEISCPLDYRVLVGEVVVVVMVVVVVVLRKCIGNRLGHRIESVVTSLESVDSDLKDGDTKEN